MKSECNDEEARRAYWSTQMDAAYAFMGKMLEYPVEECGESLVSLKEAVAAEGLAVEFSQSLIAGQDARLFYLRSGLIPDFLAVAREMNERGWMLKVEDGFRSREMQRHIALHETVLDLVLQKVIWETRGTIPDPVFLFQRLTCLIATYPKIGTHMSGSAIDISVLRASDHSEVGRGAPYLEMSELTPMESPFVNAEAARNREAISELMRHHGFIPYPQEFWHYSKGDAYAESLTASGRPARYGAVDFDSSTGRVSPILNPCEPLHSMNDIRRHIALALDRVKLRAEKIR
ncbi:MAG: M15 family metallopeptidase [bacterium]